MTEMLHQKQHNILKQSNLSNDFLKASLMSSAKNEMMESGGPTQFENMS